MLNADERLCADEGSQETTAKLQEMTPMGPVAKISLEDGGADHTESCDSWSDLSKLVKELREMGALTCMGGICADNAQPCLLGYVSSGTRCRVCGPFAR